PHHRAVELPESIASIPPGGATLLQQEQRLAAPKRLLHAADPRWCRASRARPEYALFRRFHRVERILTVAGGEVSRVRHLGRRRGLARSAGARARFRPSARGYGELAQGRRDELDQGRARLLLLALSTARAGEAAPECDTRREDLLSPHRHGAIAGRADLRAPRPSRLVR